MMHCDILAHLTDLNLRRLPTKYDVEVSLGEGLMITYAFLIFITGSRASTYKAMHMKHMKHMKSIWRKGLRARDLRRDMHYMHQNRCQVYHCLIKIKNILLFSDPADPKKGWRRNQKHAYNAYGHLSASPRRVYAICIHMLHMHRFISSSFLESYQ